MDGAVDPLDSKVGDAAVVRGFFETMPVMLVGMVGPEHRFAAVNGACRAFLGRRDLVGMRVREALPEAQGQQAFELLDRVYASGRAETALEWRVQLDVAGKRAELYVDFSVVPRFDSDGRVTGLHAYATDATERVRQRREATEAERRYRAARDVISELQEALLPTALPVLPQARVAARYLVAAHEQAAGGDWFDAIALADGRVALVIGDVVGHGVAASAAMGQLRSVLSELLVAEPELGAVLGRVDAFAGRHAATRAATLVLAVLDPATGALSYSTCGHPPPLVVGADGATRFLAPSGSGPLGTGAVHRLAADALAPDEVVLLYSDGLVERPNRTFQESTAELAQVAADAAANRVMPEGAAPTAAERVCQLTVELLTRTGYTDDVTTLAAQRLAHAVEPLDLTISGDLAGLATARRAFGEWLDRLGPAPGDVQDVQLAVVEAVTNSVEHAYPAGVTGPVRLAAELRPDGRLDCRVRDRGQWREPTTGTTHRGRGLMLMRMLTEVTLVRHDDGTEVTIRHHPHRPAVLASYHHMAVEPDRAPFSVDIDTGGALPVVRVHGPIDATSADEFTTALLSAARGGAREVTVDLTGVSLLASAGVRVLHELRGANLDLVADPGSPAHTVLDLVHLPHRERLKPPRPQYGR
ncbi:SpoIIE family protein phosphatase [Actinokineospora sp. 24-640]